MSSSASESALLRDGTSIAAEISELRLVPKKEFATLPPHFVNSVAPPVSGEEYDDIMPDFAFLLHPNSTIISNLTNMPLVHTLDRKIGCVG